jgi:hypothetical protein
MTGIARDRFKLLAVPSLHCICEEKCVTNFFAELLYNQMIQNLIYVQQFFMLCESVIIKIIQLNNSAYC